MKKHEVRIHDIITLNNPSNKNAIKPVNSKNTAFTGINKLWQQFRQYILNTKNIDSCSQENCMKDE